MGVIFMKKIEVENLRLVNKYFEGKITLENLTDKLPLETCTQIGMQIIDFRDKLFEYEKAIDVINNGAYRLIYDNEILELMKKGKKQDIINNFKNLNKLYELLFN